MRVTIRCLIQPSLVNFNKYDLLRNIVLNTASTASPEHTSPITDDPSIETIKKHVLNRKTNVNSKKKRIITAPQWVNFNVKYNNNFDSSLPKQMAEANQFFNKAKVEFEWGAVSFDSLPSEIVREKFKERTKDSPISKNPTKKYPGKTSIPFKLINGLPEITFLGRSNAGKSTILNNLLTQLGSSKLTEEARMSSRPGFTKTLNCFNIGNKFRLIDTPGYGFGSKFDQGSLTMKYIEDRKELVRCFVLIPANQGFTSLDLQIIDYLKNIGKPFEVVFTKMDKVKDLEVLKKQIQDSGILNFPTLPKLIFTNSVTSKNCQKRYGITELRKTILQSCNMLQN